MRTSSRSCAPSTDSWMSRATTVTARTFIYDTSRSSISTPIQTEVASTPMSSLAVDHLQTSSQFGHLRLLSARTCSVVCADRFVAHHDADETLPATFWTLPHVAVMAAVQWAVPEGFQSNLEKCFSRRPSSFSTLGERLADVH